MSSRLRNTVLATAASASLVLAAVPAAAAAPEGDAAAQAVPCVQKMAVVNNAGFVLSFTPTTRAGVQTPSSDQYPINQYRTLDLALANLPADTEILEYMCTENNRYFRLVPDAAPPGAPIGKPQR